MMSAQPGSRRKVNPRKYKLSQDAVANGDITRILNRQTLPPRCRKRIQSVNKERTRMVPGFILMQASRKISPEVTQTNQAMPTTDDHKKPAADEMHKCQELPGRGRDNPQNFQNLPIEECRQIYRNEINTLWKEVEDFRITCQKEMLKQRAMLDEHRRNCEKAIKEENSCSRAPDVTEDKDYTKELKTLKENMQTLEEKQKLLDKEEELVKREEQLSKRQKKLQEYEKDVQEAEALLDKRQNVAKRRSEEVEILNHDLLLMKQELAESLQNAENEGDGSESNKTDMINELTEQETSDASTVTNSPETSCKARRNWQLARRHLIDKVTLLETTIQRYRTQVASSSATITAKDMVISRLQKEATEMRDEIALKEKRIKQLESKLALSIEEKTRSEKKLDMLLEELQNIDLSATARAPSSPEKTPSKLDNLTTNKRKLLKKQQSVFSFLTHHSSDKKENSSSPELLRRRTWECKEGPKKEQGTPQKVNHNHIKPEEDGFAIGSVKNETDSVSLNDEGDKGDTDNLADFQDDLGSKACAVM